MNQNKKTVKVIWLSANKFGYETLKQVLKIKKVKLSAIITLSKKAKTRMYDGIERNNWYKFNIPVYEIKDINDEIRLINSLDPDFIIMAGWRQIIEKKILNIPRKGFIGFHPTLLPKGRGSAPIINTILSGIEKSGVTMFYLTEGIDNGNIIGQTEFKVSKDDYAQDVYDKVIRGSKKLIKEFLPLLVKGNSPRIPQDERKATYFPKRTLKDNEINLDKETTEQAHRKIRAFSKPYNGAYIKKGNKKLIIWKTGKFV